MVKQITIPSIEKIEKYEESLVYSEIKFEYDNKIITLRYRDKVKILHKYRPDIDTIICGVLETIVNGKVVSYRIVFDTEVDWIYNKNSFDIHTFLYKLQKGEIILI